LIRAPNDAVLGAQLKIQLAMPFTTLVARFLSMEHN